MEYLIIIVLQILGIGFHVMQRIAKLNLLYKDKPEISARYVVSVFMKEDWNTLIVSVLIILLNLVVHFILDTYGHDYTSGISGFQLYGFLVAFVLGYAGQRLVYKYLGTAENFLNKKVEGKLQ